MRCLPLKSSTYTVAGVTVVRKNEAQSVVPALVVKALAMTAVRQVSLVDREYQRPPTHHGDSCLDCMLHAQVLNPRQLQGR